MRRPQNKHNTLINHRILKCNHRCHEVDGYVGLKRIPYAFERGYKKCMTCECYFLRAEGYTNCKCCNFRLRVSQPSRKQHIKVTVEKFKVELATMEKIPRGRNNSLCS